MHPSPHETAYLAIARTLSLVLRLMFQRIHVVFGSARVSQHTRAAQGNEGDLTRNVLTRVHAGSHGVVVGTRGAAAHAESRAG